VVDFLFHDNGCSWYFALFATFAVNSRKGMIKYDEQNSGATHTQPPHATEPAPGTTQKQAPFVSVLGAIAVMLGACMWKRGKKA